MHTAVAVGCHSQRLDMPFILSPAALPKEVTLSLPPHSSSQLEHSMSLPSRAEVLPLPGVADKQAQHLHHGS